MRRCSNGHEVGEGFAFCPHCGERVEESPQQPEPQSEPASRAWSKVDAANSNALLFPGSEPHRRPSRRSLVIGAVVVLAAVGAIVAVAVGGAGGKPDAATSSGTTAANGASSCSSYKGIPPQSCLSKTGYYCLSYDEAAKPLDCFGGSATAKRRAVAHDKARAKASAAAAVRQARIDAAAEAWHAGYFQQDDNVYWKWVNARNCQDFAQHGCWHVKVITDNGCSSYVAVNANEYKSGTIINQLLDNQGYGIPPRTPRLFELDADAENVTADNVEIDCR